MKLFTKILIGLVAIVVPFGIPLVLAFFARKYAVTKPSKICDA